MGFAVDARYVSSFFVGETLSPFHEQDDYVDLNATVRIFDEDHRWEVALIGRNLTDELVGGNAIDLVGTGFGNGTNTGLPADTQLVTGKPMELTLQGTFRF